MTALAKRAVACNGWRWMERSADVDGRTVVDICDDGDPVWYDGETVTADDPGATPLPDLDDPATLGCLLALVREAWGPAACIMEMTGGRHSTIVISDTRGRVLFKCDGGTLAERRTIALESAP